MVVAVDSDWETRFHVAKSTVGVEETARAWIVEWYIPSDGSVLGNFRVVVNGKSCTAGIVENAYVPFTGASSIFTVSA